MNQSNKDGLKPSAEVGEGKRPAKGNSQQLAATRTQGRIIASTGLLGVREAAIRNKRNKFTSLLHHVTEELLLGAYQGLNPKASPGVDRMTWQEYGEGLEGRLRNLKDRVHRGTYRAQPSRRTYIPKADGRLRPLGVASLEDKIVQQAVVTVLSQIYEVDFLGFSYGFRPGRSPHQALDALYVGITEEKRVSWVFDADIRGFYDNIDHAWMMRFLKHRIGDHRMLRLIQKWLRAGVSEDGKWSKTTVGLPQGAVVSPLLANIYLHYVLDLWINRWRKKEAGGDVMVVRFADDFVIGFQLRRDAEVLQRDLSRRLKEFGLELHPEKTRLIEFGMFAAANRERRGEKKPETFVFLGFTHSCGRYGSSLRGLLRRRTARKRMIAKLHEVKKELLSRRHQPIPQQGKWLRSVIQGYFNYHAVRGNTEALKQFARQSARHWCKALRRRSQKARRRMTWKHFHRVSDAWIPQARVTQPLPNVRFYATHPRWEPDAGKPLVRVCPGGAG